MFEIIIYSWQRDNVMEKAGGYHLRGIIRVKTNSLPNQIVYFYMY